MKRALMLAAVAALVATTVGVSPARAAPIPGGATHVSGTWSYTNYLFVGARVNGVTSNGLTSLGCPFVLHDYGDNAIGTL
jgi:hypothetical protein